MPGQEGFRSNDGWRRRPVAYAQPLALAASLRRWSSLSRSRQFAYLLGQHPILLTEIVNRLQLALVHPASDGYQHEAEWVQDSEHLVLIYRQCCGLASNLRILMHPDAP